MISAGVPFGVPMPNQPLASPLYGLSCDRITTARVGCCGLFFCAGLGLLPSFFFGLTGRFQLGAS